MVDEQAGGEGDLVRDEDDHDLLTFSESGIRLREEIELTRTQLSGAATTPQKDSLEARLRALTSALERNTRQASANPGVKGFLEYEPRRADADSADADAGASAATRP